MRPDRRSLGPRAPENLQCPTRVHSGNELIVWLSAGVLPPVWTSTPSWLTVEATQLLPPGEGEEEGEYGQLNLKVMNQPLIQLRPTPIRVPRQANARVTSKATVSRMG